MSTVTANTPNIRGRLSDTKVEQNKEEVCVDRT